MTNARKAGSSVPDGMSFVTLTPFPALNPLNWWALAHPANALSATLHHTHMALCAWRAGADGVRAMVRAQQDALLALTTERRAEPAEAAAEQAPAPTAEDVDSAAVAAEFARPMLEMTRAYGQVGRAFIVAQRDTMRAFAEAGKPH